MERADIDQLLALGEGFTTEFKRGMPSDLGREICAFANASGGVILLGVTDSGEDVGVADHNRLKSEVQNTARSADPPIGVEVESIGDVLAITVPEQHGKPYSFGGRFHVREGASSQQLSRDEVRDFFFREGLIRMDETPCSSFDPRVELTPERWNEFARQSSIDPSLEPMAVLTNLGLLRGGAMTHAGAWLLADDITRFTLQAGVTCAVFRGSSKTHILDRRDFHGNLYGIFQDVMAYLQSKLNVALIPNAEGRDERLELPEPALREAVVNAIAHRDYRHTAKVQIYIFQDRVEIVTPGGLPAGMSEADLGSKSVPRNPLLFSILYRMRLVEQIGSGIRRIIDVCAEHGVESPDMQVSDDWFTISFNRPGRTAQQVTQHVTPQVTPQVQQLLTAFFGSMSRSELMEALGLADRNHFTSAYLRPALEADLVEMTLPGRLRSPAQRYRLTHLGVMTRNVNRSTQNG